LDSFGFDIELDKHKARMEYYVGRQASGGFVVAARLMPRDLLTVRTDVERISSGEEGIASPTAAFSTTIRQIESKILYEISSSIPQI
jgi:hypothetical protein